MSRALPPSASPSNTALSLEMTSLTAILSPSNNNNTNSTTTNINSNSHNNNNSGKRSRSCSPPLDTTLLPRNSTTGAPQISEHPELDVAARIIALDTRAKNFRTKVRFALATLAVLNFIQVIIFFFLVPPPGMGREAAATLAVHKSGVNASTFRDAWDLYEGVNKTMQKPVLLAEGGIQLTISLLALFMFLCQYVSRNPETLPGWHWVPRNASHGHGFGGGELGEMILWCIHCPIGLALVNERLRYINGFCVFRLYTVIQAGMELTDFHSSMMRVMANFFGLRLTATVFLRWALEFHKWKVLIPTLLFLWGFMALCFSFAEGLDFDTSMWFIIVTMTTVGYGDVIVASSSGRLIAILAMIAGLVVLAYIVAQVQQLTSRPEHEQRVLDALTVSKLNGVAKRAAACVFLFRFRIRKHKTQKVQMAQEEYDNVKQRLKEKSRELKKTIREIQLLPAITNETDKAFQGLRDQIDDLRLNQDAQTRMIAELTTLVKQQQKQLTQILLAQHEGEAASKTAASNNNNNGGGGMSPRSRSPGAGPLSLQGSGSTGATMMNTATTSVGNGNGSAPNSSIRK